MIESLKRFKRPINRILLTFLFVSVAILIILIFPKKGKFRYEFEPGKIWMHETLLSPFDFPVYKTAKERETEIDSIEKETSHYYNCNEQIFTHQLMLFTKEFEKEWDKFIIEHPEIYKTGSENILMEAVKLETSRDTCYEFTKELLKFIYGKGILKQTPEYLQFKKNEVNIIKVTGNITQEVNIYEVFTPLSSQEYIIQKLSALDNDTSLLKSCLNFIHEFDLSRFIKPNLSYNQVTTNKIIKESIDRISNTFGMLQEGERIIAKGQNVDERRYRILDSFRKEYETRMGGAKDFYFILVGQIILISASILILFLFLLNFRADILQNTVKVSFILFLILLFIFIGAIVVHFDKVSIYLVPFAIVPIMIRTFYDTRLALFIHLIAIFILGFLVPNGFEFVFVQFVSGIAAIFSLVSIKRRSQLFLSAFTVFCAYSIIYLGIGIIQTGNLENIEWINFAWFSGNGLLLLSSYPLIYIFEKIFGFLSDVTLMELSDTNHPLLRKLNSRAPGTFQHSLQVANLAEEAIYLIKGNPLLARVGALYHDIGKLEIPEYFVENFGGGKNPHDNIDYDKSAEIIISHIHRGVEIAKKYKLPVPVIDFIRSHQGNSKTMYFYNSYRKKYTDKEIDVKKFSYPGPIPHTKETAVVMMADSIEAASRSLRVYSAETISDLVETITGNQMKSGQYDQASITLKEIHIVKEILKKKLKNIYHARIVYPD